MAPGVHEDIVRVTAGLHARQRPAILAAEGRQQRWTPEDHENAVLILIDRHGKVRARALGWRHRRLLSRCNVDHRDLPGVRYVDDDLGTRIGQLEALGMRLERNIRDLLVAQGVDAGGTGCWWAMAAARSPSST